MLANQTNKSNTRVYLIHSICTEVVSFQIFVNASAKKSSRCRKRCITWSSKENEFTQQFSCSLPNLFRQSHVVYASVSYLNINETCIHPTSEFWTCSVCPPIFRSHEKIELFQTVYKSKRFFPLPQWVTWNPGPQTPWWHLQKIKRTQVIQGVQGDLMFFCPANQTPQSDTSSEGRSKGLMINWLPVGQKMHTY